VICVLAGGVGAARLLAGLQLVVPPEEIVAVVNTGDDTSLHGLWISPDIDTVTYTLAGAVNPDTGWGLAGETWAVLTRLRELGGLTWFNLGDKDLATHLYRTQRLAEGASLTTVTAELARANGLGVRILPVTDDPLQTRVTTVRGEDLSFQEYFVQRRHDVAVTEVRFVGAAEARPGPEVLDVLARSDVVLIAPSNPVVSIGPLLAVPGVADAIRARRRDTLAVSPIVAGAALKGPADRLLRELGHEASVTGVADLYAPLSATLVIDTADAALAGSVRRAGMEPLVTDTIMTDPVRASGLARTIIAHAAARS
jgi:LPPG:FO 2-phospho-L-lactate transferase